jgi:hypothetical protein
MDTRNVIGAFAHEGSARAAVRSLEGVGYGPDRVAVITDNPRHARELSGSRSPQGALAGLVIAVLLYGALVVMGGPQMRQDAFALVMGLVPFVIAGSAIGWLAGRSRIFVAGRAATYERAEDAGDVLVSVSVPAAERDRVRRILQDAGALGLREEGTVEAA